MTLSYPVRFIPADEGVQIIFPDLPGVVTEGADEEEALQLALPALEQALGGYVVDGRAIPSPSEICGAPTVTTARFNLLGLEAPDQL